VDYQNRGAVAGFAAAIRAVWRGQSPLQKMVRQASEPVFIGSRVALAVNVPQLFVKNPCFAGAKRRIFSQFAINFFANPTISLYDYRFSLGFCLRRCRHERMIPSFGLISRFFRLSSLPCPSKAASSTQNNHKSPSKNRKKKGVSGSVDIIAII
jgi:hypothetical protein